MWLILFAKRMQYKSGTVNSNTVNSKFHLIRSYCEIFFYHFPNISCLKCTVNSNFHLIRSKTLPTNDFELTVPDLYAHTCRPIKFTSIYLEMWGGLGFITILVLKSCIWGLSNQIKFNNETTHPNVCGMRGGVENQK